MISCAGFGQRISWKDEGRRPEGYELSFKVREDILAFRQVFVLADYLALGNYVPSVHGYHSESSHTKVAPQT